MDTDSQVLEDLTTEFKRMALLHSARLTFRVQDGIVTVAGRVNTFAQRKAVERIATRVAGIRTLVLEIGASIAPRPVHSDGADSGIGTFKEPGLSLSGCPR